MATNWQIGDKILGRWEIFKILRGHVSIVYFVYSHEFNKPFAIKTLRDEVFAWDPSVAESFTQEALAWVCLDIHPNVTQAQLVQKIEGKPYLFMEYVGGGHLGDWIGTPRLTKDLPQVLRFAIQFCNGMTHVLSRGIKAHGRIKPQNCLITEDNVLKVTDLGLARVFNKMALEGWEGREAGEKAQRADESSAPSPGSQPAGGKEEAGAATGGSGIEPNRRETLIKTDSYRAPEQLRDLQHIDVRADIYSFGVLLFQMIVGQLPSPGQTWREFARLHNVQRFPALNAILETCLAEDPHNRFKDFITVRERLTEVYEALMEEPTPPGVGAGAEAGPADLVTMQKPPAEAYERPAEEPASQPEAEAKSGPAGRSAEEAHPGDLVKDKETEVGSELPPVSDSKEEQAVPQEEVPAEPSKPVSVLRMTYVHQGKEEGKILHGEAIIGRRKEGILPDLDLSFDRFVSRLQARVWEEEGEWWIEDLDSNNGTRVNGEEIKGKGKRRLQPGENLVQVGKTKLRMQVLVLDPEALDAQETSFLPLPELPIEIVEALDAGLPTLPVETASASVTRKPALLHELPLQFMAQTRLDLLLQMIVERAMEIIPKAKRGALLFKEPATEQLLKAYLSKGEPIVSTAMAQQAVERREAFIWLRSRPASETRKNEAGSLAPEALQRHTESGMYAPLLWKGKVLGVLCVDNCKVGPTFERTDLQLLLSIARYAAMAVANYKRQDDSRRNATLVKKLFTNFPPKTREKLLEKSRRGRLRPGGRKSEATVLYADLRGFTSLTASMETEKALSLLNSYFPTLAKIIFKYQGTIGRFLDGMILTVFGSPEPDGNQHENAVRAALEMQETVTKLNAARAARSQVTCNLGIGIHCGEVLSGFVGLDLWMDFTIVGEALTHALLYCQRANAGEVLVSPRFYERVRDRVLAEEVSLGTLPEGDLAAYRIKGLKP